MLMDVLIVALKDIISSKRASRLFNLEAFFNLSKLSLIVAFFFMEGKNPVISMRKTSTSYQI